MLETVKAVKQESKKIAGAQNGEKVNSMTAKDHWEMVTDSQQIITADYWIQRERQHVEKASRENVLPADKTKL